MINIIIIIIKTFEVLIKGRKEEKHYIRQKGAYRLDFSKTGKLAIRSTGRIGTGRPDL